MTLFTSPVSWPASWPSPQKLLDAAREAQRASYSPYSGFPVGAALFVEGMDDLILACNVENGSYGLSICAERSAIFRAVASEGPAMKLASIAVVCPGHEFPPCGACRQVIAEFATPDTHVCFLQNGAPVALTMAELLPGAFAGAAMNRAV